MSTRLIHMQKGISYQGFLPLKKEPSDRAEMLSQLLFGGSSIQFTKVVEKPENETKTGDMMVIHPSASGMNEHEEEQFKKLTDEGWIVPGKEDYTHQLRVVKFVKFVKFVKWKVKNIATSMPGPR